MYQILEEEILEDIPLAMVTLTTFIDLDLVEKVEIETVLAE